MLISGKIGMKNKLWLVFLIALIFLEGIWLEKVTEFFQSLLLTYFFESGIQPIRNFALLLHQKIPVITENLFVFILAILHLLLTILCLKILFSWTSKTFLKVYLACYGVFCVISIFLIYAYAAQSRFFQVWKDFKELFFSPFPLIFMFLIYRLLENKAK
jgi:hypothetical protein